MNKSRLIFIGPLRLGSIPSGGDTMKNNLFIKRFIEIFHKVYIIDTINWKKKPFILLKLFYYLLFFKAKIVISCERGAEKLINFFYYLKIKRDIFYFVIGSGFPTRISKGLISPRHYLFLKAIIVQSPTMVQELNNKGLNNVIFLPNSKPIYKFNIQKKQGKKNKFVFISRILPEKGIELIFNCFSRLNLNGYKEKVSLDIYGVIEKHYHTFTKTVSQFENIQYKGLLNLTSVEGYKTLSSYDLMLFPTYYDGEGFPGVFIDAFIAGLPIITTNWHYNAEYIQNGKTGFIIPPKDENALYNIMKYILDNRKILDKMSDNCRKEAEKYNINIILNDERMKRIGLIE